MSSLFNPYALTALGKPLQQRQSPELRAEGGPMTRSQMDMARFVFGRFLEQARLSYVPNPTQQGFLSDGSRFRIVTASGAPIMQVWPVQPQVGNPKKGEIYAGYLYETNEKRYVVDVITEDGKHTGKWGVRYIDKGIRLVPLFLAENKQNIVIDGPKGSKIPYLYATDRERGYLFSGGIPHVELLETNGNFYYLQHSVSKVVNGTDSDSAKIYVLWSNGVGDITYGQMVVTDNINIKNVTNGVMPTVTPPLHVIGFYPSLRVGTLSVPRQFSRDGQQVIQVTLREVDNFLSIKDLPNYENRKILSTRNSGIILPDSDVSADVTDIVNEYYNNAGVYKSAERIYRLFSVSENGLEPLRDISAEVISIHPEMMDRLITFNSLTGKWTMQRVGGTLASEGKTSVPVSYKETDNKNKISSWRTGERSYSLREEFDRDFSASYSKVSKTALDNPLRDFFDFSGKLIEGDTTTEVEYVFSGNCSKLATYNHQNKEYYDDGDRVMVPPGMNPAILECNQISGSGTSSTAATSITTEEKYSVLATRNINGLAIETYKENTTVKTSNQKSLTWANAEVLDSKRSFTVEVDYIVEEREILLVDQYLDLIIYRETKRSHSYTSEYYTGDLPKLSDMVESVPTFVVVHNKKEVRRYLDDFRRDSPPYSYMNISCFRGFEWAEMGVTRSRIPEERMMYGQREESLGFGYISTNIIYMAKASAYYPTDNSTVTYIKSPSTGSSLVHIKAGKSVFSLFVDKVSVHDYHDVMQGLELGTPEPTRQVI